MMLLIQLCALVYTSRFVIETKLKKWLFNNKRLKFLVYENPIRKVIYPFDCKFCRSAQLTIVWLCVYWINANVFDLVSFVFVPAVIMYFLYDRDYDNN